MLDRLLRGRVWIGLLGVLLIGLVAINVSLLKFNAEAGRNAEKAKALTVQNAELRARVSRLRSSDRIESAGRALGLGMPAAGQVRYLSARLHDGVAAAKSLRKFVWAEFQAPEIATDAAPAAIVPAVAAAQVTPAVGATGPTGATGPALPVTPAPTTAPVPTTTQAPVSQPATTPAAGGTAQPVAPGAAAAPVTTQP
jgi:hypothetical protein